MPPEPGRRRRDILVDRTPLTIVHSIDNELRLSSRRRIQRRWEEREVGPTTGFIAGLRIGCASNIGPVIQACLAQAAIMAAAAETAKPTAAHNAYTYTAGRSTSDYDAAFPSSYTTTATSSPKKRLRLVTSSSSSSKPKVFGDVYSAGASPASSTTYFPTRNDSRSAGASKMSASHITTIPAGGRHAKLHKRGGSGSSLPGSSLPTPSALSQTPSGYDETYTPTSATPTGSIPKIRPYLRKMSTKEDTEQGRLDLSKSISENHALSGLGIHDLAAPRSASDVSFTHTTKRSHARTTSGESNLSTTSSTFRPTKPFVHPMRQTPRPYTPPHGHSFDSSTMNDEERNESDDVLTDDDGFRLGHGFRSRRSVSISSTPVVAPTPLSQSHTAFDLGMVPKITANSSQTNLSIKSNKSGKSSKSRPSGTRSRRNTERSFETLPTMTTASGRTSLDKAFSFATGGRRSDTEPLTREERIEAARRKFEEREGKKERKNEERVLKRRETEEAKVERQRRKSEASERAKVSKKGSPGKKGGDEGRYEDFQPENLTSWPQPGHQSEKPAKATRKIGDTKPQGGLEKFSTWVRVTVLSCGRKG